MAEQQLIDVPTQKVVVKNATVRYFLFWPSIFLIGNFAMVYEVQLVRIYIIAFIVLGLTGLCSEFSPKAGVRILAFGMILAWVIAIGVGMCWLGVIPSIF